VNLSIRRLFVVFLLLFGLLVAKTSWWTVARSDDLERNYASVNKRDLLRGLKVPRGTIRAADGTILTRSVKNGEGVFSRHYPTGSLFSHPVGYSFTQTGQSGLEAYYNPELSRGASTGARSLLDKLAGNTGSGDSLRTTLDPKAQKLAEDLLAKAAPDTGGSVVALDPRDGAVKVMASTPTYSANSAATESGLGRLNKDEKRHPLVDRSLQFGYAPGSTMKVVTLAAALDSGKFSLQSQVSGRNGVNISGVPLQNDEGETYGDIDLKTALTRSVNTVYAQVAEKLGKKTMRDYMERFGFDSKPMLDYPKSGMSSSGEYLGAKLIPPTSSAVDIGRVGIGQHKLRVTPLQMAQVAAAVANGGKLMRPHIGDYFVDSDGRVSKRIEPRLQSTVMKPQTAKAVTEAMVSVVDNGTGQAARIPGIKVAGKTGTAETEVGRNQRNKLWFIAFAPADHPRIAIAVTVDNVVGFGGQVAAPIAKSVMQELLKR
jgi:peptidoglycan glycosyltransferase